MAKIITPSAEEWAVLEGVIRQIQEAGCDRALIIPPVVAEKFRAIGGSIVESGLVKGYDFGGQPDLAVDVVSDPDGFLDDTSRDAFTRKLEDMEMDIKMEGAAIAFGFRPSWWTS